MTVATWIELRSHRTEDSELRPGRGVFCARWNRVGAKTRSIPREKHDPDEVGVAAWPTLIDEMR